MSTKEALSDAELMRLPRDGRKYELVDGEVRVSPAGARHGQIIMRLGARLTLHVEERRLGDVLDPSTGFRLPGGNVRCPDLSFVAAGRWGEGGLPEGFAELAPDLAVEVVSPSDSEREVLDKVGEYLEAGVRQVWVIEFQRRRAAVYRSLTDVRELAETDSLDGGEVVPGFRVALADLLA